MFQYPDVWVQMLLFKPKCSNTKKSPCWVYWYTGTASSDVKISGWTQQKCYVSRHTLLYDHTWSVWSSSVFLYPYNSLCSRVGEMHCKASKGPEFWWQSHVNKINFLLPWWYIFIQFRWCVEMLHLCTEFSTLILEERGTKQKRTARLLDGDWLCWTCRRKLLRCSHKCKLLSCSLAKSTNFWTQFRKFTCLSLLGV